MLCVRAVTIRAATSMPKPVAVAATALAPANTTSRARSSALRGSRRVSAVTSGPPTATVRAYQDTSSPADGTGTRRPAESVGSRPTITYSAVPTVKTHPVSAVRAGHRVLADVFFDMPGR